MVESTRLLVQAESPSSDLAACELCVEVAATVVSEWLGERARVEVHGGRPVLRWGPPSPRVLLLGHLDTVWPVGTLTRLPWTADEERMTGPGVFDMKAGAVQGIAALASLAHLDLAPLPGVGLLLTTDEETGSLASRDLLREASSAASAVLVLEPSVDGALKTARKGTSWYALTLHGRAAHAGLDPYSGVNALTELAHLVHDATTWADPGAGTTVTPTTATAGTTANTVPDRADLTLDVRAWTSAEQHRVDLAVRGWRPQHHEATYEVGGGIDRPAMEESASAPLDALARTAADRLGIALPAGRSVGGASDGNLTAAWGVPTLDGLGAVGAGAHADDEWASVPALPERAALVAALAADLLDGPGAGTITG